MSSDEEEFFRCDVFKSGRVFVLVSVDAVRVFRFGFGVRRWDFMLVGNLRFASMGERALDSCDKG